MTRKSSIITLCIVGTLGTLGACCCCSGYFDQFGNPAGGAGGGGVGHGHGWFRPVAFWGGGGGHPVGPGAVGTRARRLRR